MNLKPLLFVVLLFCCSLVHAQDTSISKEATLLAVTESNGVMSGSTAQLTLEIRPGIGRVFIDTTPLTKLDTQISTRLAKEIACTYANVDCSMVDFIYTIKSSAPIVGGPSAGSTLAAITVAALLDKDVPEDIALTGTINSGGIVGPVGGVIHKMDAAQKEGITTVLIPYGEVDDRVLEFSLLNDSQNISMTNSTDPKDHGESIGLTVIEVGTLDEVLHYYLDMPLLEQDISYHTPDFYTETMRAVAVEMCAHTADLLREFNRIPMPLNQTNYGNLTVQSPLTATMPYRNFSHEQKLVADATVLFERGQNATESQRYYAAASFCFGASVKSNTAILLTKSDDELNKIRMDLNESIVDFDTPKIQTQTDLQTYMLVKERLLEAQKSLNDSMDNVSSRVEQIEDLSYAMERFNSAHSWSSFFGKPGRKLTINKETIAVACDKKIAEAEERRQYVGLFLPEYSMQRSENLVQAYNEQDTDNDELCLYYASQAKAEYDVIIGALGISSEADFDNALMIKTGVVTKAISRQESMGNYPIMAYSFLEYADTLSTSDKSSSLLYAQYAMELADVTTYFDSQETTATMIFSPLSSTQNKSALFFSLLGFFAGLFVAFVVFQAEKYYITKK